jgi:cell division septation protein DedD
MSDEGFHEIQLNGKQLVFLFMAATVVAVVVFLCGVMVGRGVPTRAATLGDGPQQASLDPTALEGLPSSSATPDSGDAPATARETLTYPELLEDPNPPAETLAPAADPAASPTSRAPPTAPRTPPAVSPTTAPARVPAAAAPQPAASTEPIAAAPRPAPKPAPEPAAPKPLPAAAAVAEPAGAGFVVQVAAVRQREEADTIARRLTGKGYPAFVSTSGTNFRVRVGKYEDRREAESVAGRLEREEQFKPWITR